MAIHSCRAAFSFVILVRSRFRCLEESVQWQNNMDVACTCNLWWNYSFISKSHKSILPAILPMFNAIWVIEKWQFSMHLLKCTRSFSTSYASPTVMLSVVDCKGISFFILAPYNISAASNRVLNFAGMSSLKVNIWHKNECSSGDMPTFLCLVSCSSEKSSQKRSFSFTNSTTATSSRSVNRFCSGFHTLEI